MKRLLILIIAVLACLAVPVSAHYRIHKNLTISNAGKHAANWQRNNCGDFTHICVDPLSLWPICADTNVNKRNWTQYDCNGQMEETYWPGVHVLPSVYCAHTKWDPYGTLLYHKIYSC